MMMNLSDCDHMWNLTDPVSAKNVLHSTLENIVIGLAMPCVLAIGLIANLAFLFVIYRVPYMRTTTNFYLAHLAVSDIVFMTVAVLEKVVARLSSPISGDRAFTSSAGCVCYVLIVYITYFASIGLMGSSTQNSHDTQKFKMVLSVQIWCQMKAESLIFHNL